MIDRLQMDERIEEVEIGEDIIVITNLGFCWEEDCNHTRGFDTLKEALDSLELIVTCSGKEGCCQQSI